ncbi:MAG TPA: DUF4380 domain-containing protein [bacterium]|nr:DUF4380 domain-containing protein [bacterium]
MKRKNVSVREAVYRGWRECIEMVNDTVRVIVVPPIGRIMHYGFREDRNVIWVNRGLTGKFLSDICMDPDKPDAPWANFGGDKVWPLEQFRWAEVNGREWPPDPWFDGSPYAAERVRDGVRMTGPVSRFCGARLVREIQLAESGAQILIRNRLEKVQPAGIPGVEPLPMTVWSVTQIRTPEAILTPLNSSGGIPGRVHFFNDDPETRSHFTEEHGIGVFLPSRTAHQKIGTNGDGWLGAVSGKRVFAQTFSRTSGAVHPDGDLSVEAYTSPDGYAELELLSPLRLLDTGETTEWDVAWTLSRLPEISDEESRRKEAVRLLNDLPSLDAAQECFGVR